MEKVVLFCVFLHLIVQITSSVSEHGVSLLRFRMNERIALNCSFTHKTDDIAWYRQSPQSWKTNSAGVCQQHRKKPVYRLLQSPDTYSRHSEENSLASDLCSNRVGRRSLFLWKKCHDFRNAIRKPHQTRDGGRADSGGACDGVRRSRFGRACVFSGYGHRRKTHLHSRLAERMDRGRTRWSDAAKTNYFSQ
ncbi:uncharacterized protein LOC122335159 isoform X3 [Puntigrus tetrazona]|uniref:uncharacterized protein LOC122335159 isoform X3 n=1 Tax=Puntigrus tetrazona TaxID=1606681 RepID=UPI001C8A8241|nr:uncharacterized protein LOC122335159 isoform X3 [Puntigrus tetrazona]